MTETYFRISVPCKYSDQYAQSDLNFAGHSCSLIRIRILQTILHADNEDSDQPRVLVFILALM